MVHRLSKEEQLSSLPPVARALLDASRRLLEEGGFEALRLDAIAAEAGENKAMIRYYFGDKDGLIEALVDSLIHDAQVAVAEQIRLLPPGPERLRADVEGLRRMAEDSGSFRAFFSIIPHVLGTPELRSRIALLYDWYREVNARAVAGSRAVGDPEAAGIGGFDDPDPRAVALGALMTAAVDGLALQALLDPAGFQVGPSFAALADALESLVGEGRQDEGRQDEGRQ